MRFKFFACALTLTFSANLHASGVMEPDAVKAVQKQSLESEQLSKVAGYLAEYEIQAKKLIEGLKSPNLVTINNQSTALLNLSQSVIDSAKFRLPQCDAYLAKTLVLKAKINTISLASLESDYHHDGVLPKAPAECYHTKDLFVHPATVLVHTRNNPSLTKSTTDAIEGEIAEVLTHLELVRQLVVY